jgi:hypothetical protein
MNRLSTVMVITGAMFVGQLALADDLANPASMSKRQKISLIIDCMKKRMSADRAISYHEAAKVCKDDMKRDDGAPSSSALVASDSQIKH